MIADAPPAAACPALPRLIGHRGLAAHAPENTLAGIRMAAERGLGWVELDAKLTSDGVAILMHDDTLDRTTNGSGPVAEAPFARIRGLDAGRWFAPAFAGEPVPTLEAAIALLVERDMGCNLEIKPCPGREMETAQAVAAALDAHWPSGYGRLLVSSFAPAAMARLRDVAPSVPRGLLVWDRTATMLDEAAVIGCVSIHCAHQHLDAAQARAIRAASYRLLVYTVNDPILAARLIGWGCDTIISDTGDALGDLMGDDRETRGSCAARTIPAAPRNADGTDPVSGSASGRTSETAAEGPNPAA